MDMRRLDRQLQFILEADRVKQVIRRTLLLDGSRLENDAEHSWHAALAAMVLSEYANQPELDLGRVIKMLTIHDMVEIDAGDTYAYDEAAHLDKEERELKAAERIFGLLPEDLGAEMRGLWDEFEAQDTPEAKFAGAMDCFMPLLHNYVTQGAQWRKHGVSRDQVLARNHARIAGGSTGLADYVRQLVAEAVEKGYLLP
ncbi:MAG: HD domain-containing protein [Bacillota bacterium]